MSAVDGAAVARVAREAGGSDIVEAAAGEPVQCRLRPAAVPGVAERLQALGLEPQLLTAAHTRAPADQFTLLYLFAPPTHRPSLLARVALEPQCTTFPSLATRSFALSRFEREVHDLFGLVPAGHPDLRRLTLHQFWPDGYHPLRDSSEPPPRFADRGQPFPFRRVEGAGVFEITVGPVHAGIIEPGHFRFSVEGETIVHLETRLGFVHKGVEKLFETLPFERTPELAERISGDTAVGHSLAFCQALEALAGCRIPTRAAWLRVLALELERLYNHVGDVGMIVNDTGYAFGHAHCVRLREQLLRLNARLTGHRLLRGAVVPGGIGEPLATAPLGDAVAAAERVVDEFAELARMCLENTTVLERLQGTGRLTTRTAREMQVVGVVGRASGIDADARRDAPFAAYGGADLRVPVHATGDVWARTMVRLEETRQSMGLIRVAAAQAGDRGVARSPLGALRPGADAVGLVEGWRGPIWHWVTAAGPSSLARVKVVDPSFRNWPALEYAVLNNIVPDFPLCNKSFNLSYSGNDL
ncbi:MAG TPA: NADH-quinone oxidoreductase subunit C [Methylomirabilota bacterium]|nr:NADH-quinone oxidoreductase subunit C [Methylomirabilota bacterium]